MRRSFLDLMNPFEAPPPHYDEQGLYTAPPSPWSQMMGQLPQPAQMFGGQQATYQPGWSDVWQHLWRGMTGEAAPPPTPPADYNENPSYWPPNHVPFGPNF